LYLKSQIPSTKLQINHKFQISNRSKAIVFLFVILNFGHCYLFVFWDLLFEISEKQILSGSPQVPLMRILPLFLSFIQHSMLDVGCSMFIFSIPPAQKQLCAYGLLPWRAKALEVT